MKTMNHLFIMLFALIFISCKREINITEIITNPNQVYVGDTVLQIAITEKKIDKTKYDWTITDPNGNDVSILDKSNNTMTWIPETAGIFWVEVEGKRNSSDEKIKQSVVVATDSLSFYKNTIIGKWSGSAETNWGDSYSLEVEFFSNGTYSAQATTGGFVAFYYGSDIDNPQKTYQIELSNEPLGYGHIVIYFQDSGTTVNDELKNIQFSSDATSMQFDFWHLNAYHIAYDLTRM